MSGWSLLAWSSGDSIQQQLQLTEVESLLQCSQLQLVAREQLWLQLVVDVAAVVVVVVVADVTF